MSKRKTDIDNPNNDFCEFLTELAEYEKNVNRNIHKYNAYRKAAKVLAELPSRIRSGKEAKRLNGVGDKISKKIDEYLETGTLRKLDSIHKDKKSNAINLLTKISGMGPAKAQSLVIEGICTLDDLRKNISKLTHHQQIGLKYFDDFQERVPREEIQKIDKVLVKEIKKLDSKFDITICGSFRRGKQDSGDIDTLITHPEYTSDKMLKKRKNKVLETIVEALQRCGLVTETLASGETKFMGVCRLSPELPARRLDIRFTPHNQYYCTVLHFTGSDIFNQELRTHALEKGFTLNEYTLRPLGSTGIPGEPVDINSEQDIFDIIEYPYRKPQERG